MHTDVGVYRVRAGPHRQRFGTSVSSPGGKYEALINATLRWARKGSGTDSDISARSPSTTFKPNEPRGFTPKLP